MKTERFLFCIEWKQTNTTKYTEIDSVQRRQHILFFYIWMAIVDVEIVEEDSRELEEL